MVNSCIFLKHFLGFWRRGKSFTPKNTLQTQLLKTNLQTNWNRKKSYPYKNNIKWTNERAFFFLANLIPCRFRKVDEKFSCLREQDAPLSFFHRGRMSSGKVWKEFVFACAGERKKNENFGNKEMDRVTFRKVTLFHL